MRDEEKGMIIPGMVAWSDIGDPTNWAVDPGRDDDYTGIVFRIGPSIVLSCTLPRHLGGIVEIFVRGNRVVVVTTSGVDFIVPNFKIEGVKHADGGIKK